MTRLVIMIGGILALVSLLFTWWFSYYGASYYHSSGEMISLVRNSSKLIYNIPPVEEGTSPGVPINDTSFGIHYHSVSFLIPIVILLVLIAAFTAIVSSEIRASASPYEIIAAATVLAAVVLFILVLVYTAGFSLLAGRVHEDGLNGFWGLGPGVFIAIAAAVLMIWGRRPAKRQKA